MNDADKEYFRLIQTVLKDGRVKHNRTGIDTIGVFGEQAKFGVDLEAFPILTTKRVWFKGIVHELLWFIRGDTNIKYLVDNDVHIWDEWAYKRYNDYCKSHPENTFEVNPTGDLGGNRWRSSWTQERFIEEIKNDRNFATYWGELGEGTYGSVWRAFPYYTEGGIGDYVDYGHGYQKSTHTFGTVDQLKKVLDKLKTNPDDRRMIVSAWHPYWVDHCALPPCHCLFHFNTEELTLEERMDYAYDVMGMATDIIDEQDTETFLEANNVPARRLNLLLYQRSCDTGLGVPYNITSYSLLLAMVAQVTNMKPGVFTHTYGDLHIYKNHIESLQGQITRTPYKLPGLWLNPEVKELFDFKYDDIKLINYEYHPTIKMDIAV
jgi:thymidylate synthase